MNTEQRQHPVLGREAKKRGPVPRPFQTSSRPEKPKKEVKK